MQTDGAMTSSPAEVLTPYQTRTLSLCEEEIERDIAHDRETPKSTLKRFRKHGDEVLHSPAVLLTVVVLNCLDCLLVLSELVLDVYFIKEMIDTAENTMETFNQMLLDKYPDRFGGLQVHNTHKFYNRVLHHARLTANNSIPRDYPLVVTNGTTHCWVQTLLANRTRRSVSIASNGDKLAATEGHAMHFGEADDPHFLEEQVHSIEEKIAHVLHKLSVTILGILVLFTLLKVFCQGLSFVKHKLEVFDGIVVMASFTLDVCYINGLTNYPVESFMLILAIMIPWRIIRVLNSLVIAVKDNFHFLLKLMYKKNKYQRERLEYLERTHTRHQNMITVLTKVCENNGVTPALINTFFEVAELPLQKKFERRTFPFAACFTRQESMDASFRDVKSRDIVATPVARQRPLSSLNEVDGDDENPQTPESNPLLNVEAVYTVSEND